MKYLHRSVFLFKEKKVFLFIRTAIAFLFAAIASVGTSYTFFTAFLGLVHVETCAYKYQEQYGYDNYIFNHFYLCY